MPILRRRSPRRAAVSGRPGRWPGGQPGGGGCADAEVAAAVAGELDEEGGHRLGDRDVLAAEAEEYLLTAVDDLVGGHGGDGGELLAVEQEQGAGDPVGELEVFVRAAAGATCAQRSSSVVAGPGFRPVVGMTNRRECPCSPAQSRKSRTS